MTVRHGTAGLFGVASKAGPLLMTFNDTLAMSNTPSEAPKETYVLFESFEASLAVMEERMVDSALSSLLFGVTSPSQFCEKASATLP